MARRAPLVHRSLHSGCLSKTWLVADRPGGHAVLIDSGGPLEPIVSRIEEWGVTPTHVLCTHHHHDHVAHNGDYRDRYGCPVCGHRRESELFGDLDAELEDGDEVRSGELVIRAMHVPGHTRGQLAFLVNEVEVFTGDTLFRGSVGGTRGPGHTTFEDLRRSIMDVLMRLPAETVVRPGHTDSSTIGREWEENPFVRVWRGLEAAEDVACEAFGEPATLLVRARDYDGGLKCQVRFADGTLAVVPGSRVEIPGRPS
jgi:glyoxylase-like metal-dependent hydrolase (beta-lactamase superfamily II)